MRQWKKSKANAPNANEWIPFCVYSFNGFYYFIIQPYDFSYIHIRVFLIIWVWMYYLALIIMLVAERRIVYEMGCQTANKNHHRLSLETDKKKKKYISLYIWSSSTLSLSTHISCHAVTTEIWKKKKKNGRHCVLRFSTSHRQWEKKIIWMNYNRKRLRKSIKAMFRCNLARRWRIRVTSRKSIPIGICVDPIWAYSFSNTIVHDYLAAVDN